MQDENFYRAFEEAYRGSRKLIKNRVSIYLPFILPLKDIYPQVESLDIGCGRGEWLELLQENNIKAKGIDFDARMLEACNKIDLNVLQGDGIDYLKTLDNESFAIISAFHVVEHISFEDLQIFTQEAHRVLKPGGLLIMETPNPENIKVATENFYLDPTHIRPIPSERLKFMADFYGFYRSKILRLQEPKELEKQEYANLLDVIEGVSPDYAIIAQKNAQKNILEKFDNIFSKEFGLTLHAVFLKFESRLVNIEQKLTHAEITAKEAEKKVTQTEFQLKEAEKRANNALHHYQLVVNSNSWKITKPLRLLRKFIKYFTVGIYNWLTFSPTNPPKQVMKQVLIKTKYQIDSNPKLKSKILLLLNNFPKVKEKLKSINNSNHKATNHFGNNVSSFKQLSPSAKKIYNDFQNAIQIRKGIK